MARIGVTVITAPRVQQQVFERDRVPENSYAPKFLDLRHNLLYYRLGGGNQGILIHSDMKVFAVYFHPTPD